jgi:hypothetical protein
MDSGQSELHARDGAATAIFHGNPVTSACRLIEYRSPDGNYPDEAARTKYYADLREEERLKKRAHRKRDIAYRPKRLQEPLDRYNAEMIAGAMYDQAFALIEAAREDFADDPSLFHIRREIALAHTIFLRMELRKALAAETQFADPDGTVAAAARALGAVKYPSTDILQNQQASDQLRKLFLSSSNSPNVFATRYQSSLHRALAVLCPEGA